MRELDIKTKEFLDTMILQSNLPPDTTHNQILKIIKKEFEIRTKLIGAINDKLINLSYHFQKDFKPIANIDSLDDWSESIVICNCNEDYDLVNFVSILDLKLHHLLSCKLRVQFGEILLDFKISDEKLKMLREYI